MFFTVGVKWKSVPFLSPPLFNVVATFKSHVLSVAFSAAIVEWYQTGEYVLM